MDKENTAKIEFDEDAKKFEEELGQLLDKYKLTLSIKLKPTNLFTKIFSKFLKVSWNLISIRT